MPMNGIFFVKCKMNTQIETLQFMYSILSSTIDGKFDSLLKIIHEVLCLGNLISKIYFFPRKSDLVIFGPIAQ